MSQNKKIYSFFFILIVICEVIFWYPNLFFKKLNPTDYKSQFLILLFLPILFSIFITTYSYVKKLNIVLSILGILLSVLTIATFLIVYSISNFGF